MPLNVIGIDPDLRASGVATVENGKLIFLQCLDFASLMAFCQHKHKQGFIFVVENVLAHKAIYANKRTSNAGAMGAIGKNVGQCQGVYACIVNMLSSIGAVIYTPPPLKGIQKKAKTDAKLFKTLTGWSGQSNPDTRDAAMLALSNYKAFPFSNT